jgi:hypothetical protein
MRFSAYASRRGQVSARERADHEIEYSLGPIAEEVRGLIERGRPEAPRVRGACAVAVLL